MVKKTFEPVEESFYLAPLGNRRDVRRVICRLADDGLRISVATTETTVGSLDDLRPEKAHISPAKIIGMFKGMGGESTIHPLNVFRHGFWGLRVVSFYDEKAVAAFDMFTMAKWFDCVAFPEEEEMHRRLWDQLRLHRASHLISAPIEKKPEPEPIHFAPVDADEIIEADFEQAEPVATTAIVSAEHQVEPAQQQSITGLGLRRFVRSSLLFARDVAVDVTSRIVSRSLLG